MIAWKPLAFSVAMVAVGTFASTALTASNSLPSTMVGYGTSTISGASASSIVFTLNPDGTVITDAVITFTGDLTSGSAVEAGFGSDSLTVCTVGAFSGTSTTLEFRSYAAAAGQARA